MKLVELDPSVKANRIKEFDKLLFPLGFVNILDFTFYNAEYDVRFDCSALAIDKVVECAIKEIYHAGLNFGIASTQRVIRNALGMEK